MLKIGSFCCENPIIIAPLSGVTDYPYRKVARRFSRSGLLFSEMLSAESIVRSHKETLRMAVCDKKEQPMAVQIVGNCEKTMAKASMFCQEKGAVLVDVNMGCPVKKITSNNSGASLMKDKEQAKKIILEIKKTIDIPLTVKIRKGWSEDEVNALDFAKMLQDLGVDAVTIHGRTKQQMYSGKADWNIIKKLKQTLDIPVIGNGDVFNHNDARQMFDFAKCDGIMIGRGAMGRPWIQKETYSHLFEKKEFLLSYKQQKQIALFHFDNLLDYYGNYKGLRVSRKHVSWYLKGLRNSNEFRNYYNKIEDENLARQEISNFYDEKIKG